jgi:hypothetical protein
MNSLEEVNPSHMINAYPHRSIHLALHQYRSIHASISQIVSVNASTIRNIHMPLVTVLSSPIQNSQHYFSSFMPSVVLSWKSSHTQSHISPRAGQAPCMEQLVSIVPWREQKRRTEYAICQDSTLLSGLVSITASCALARSTYYSPRTKLLCQITCPNLGCWLVLLAVTLHPSPGMAYVRACMDGPISPRP